MRFSIINSSLFSDRNAAEIASDSMYQNLDFRVKKSSHAVICVVILAFVSWGLLTSDPLAAVKRSPFSILTTISDLIMHCGAYATLSAVCISLSSTRRETWVTRAVLSLLVVHGIGTEILQIWIPRRTCDPLDAMANIAGITLGAAFAAWLTSPKPARTAVHG